MTPVLNRMTPADAARLRALPLPTIEAFGIAELRGELIRVKTASENCYFIEITDVEEGHANIYRCDSRSERFRAGFIANLSVDRIFRVGWNLRIWTKEIPNAHTSIVTELAGIPLADIGF